MTPTIFKINWNHHLLSNCSHKNEIVEKILEIAEKEDKIKFDYPLQTEFINNIPVHYLSYKTKNESISTWYNFLVDEVEELDIEHFQETKVSVVIFIEEYNNLYCITGGSGFNLVKKYIDYDFGLNIYSRIYDPTHQIKNIETRNISGLLYNSNSQYATNFNAENLAFTDRILQKLTVELNENQDDFTIEKDFNGGIVLKFDSGVQLKNSLNIKQLVNFISEIDQIFQFPPKFEISNYALIEDEKIKEQLNDKLIDKLKEDFRSIERNIEKNNRTFAFEFCAHSNVQAFYDSNSYSFDYKKKSTNTDKKSVKKYTFNELDILFLNGMNFLFNNQILDHNSPNYLIKAEMKNLGLVYYIGSVAKRTPFMYAINTEIEIDNTKYFFINSKWYKLSQTVQQNLNKSLQQLFQTSELSKPYHLKPWDNNTYKNEGEYNLDHIQENIVIMDKCIVDNIELCDILKIDHENKQLFLYHVKQKFAHDVRVLCNQINIAAKKLTYIINGTDIRYFDKLINTSNYQNYNPESKHSSENFLYYFKNYKIAFVFAVTGNNANTEIKNAADKYGSSIAKFSILELHQTFKSSYNFELYYHQIMVK